MPELSFVEVMAGSSVIGLLCGVVIGLQQHYWPERPPSEHEIRLFNEHGILIRKEKISAKRMAQLIHQIDDGWYK